ncbi:MAG: hypothetical protein KAR13_00085, partial [Desulfobulbaceae bacterium]|nr:hypothetical protein [Desulfobulbaceae bacterium]
YKPFLLSKCLYIVIRWRKAYNMWYAISYIKYPEERSLFFTDSENCVKDEDPGNPKNSALFLPKYMRYER